MEILFYCLCGLAAICFAVGIFSNLRSMFEISRLIREVRMKIIDLKIKEININEL